MWKIAVVGLLFVGVLYLATRQPVAPKSTDNASNALLAFGLTNALAFGQKLFAPSKTPELEDSKAAATKAVADGLPVSATQGNELFTPAFLDGTSLVAS